MTSSRTGTAKLEGKCTGVRQSLSKLSKAKAGDCRCEDKVELLYIVKDQENIAEAPSVTAQGQYGPTELRISKSDR